MDLTKFSEMGSEQRRLENDISSLDNQQTTMAIDTFCTYM